jgi:subtilisin-like proprotein convertase family protein
MRYVAALLLLIFVPTANADIFNFGPTNFNAAIPEIGSVSADIVVGAGSGFTDITDINVFVDVDHEATGDLKISLEHLSTATVVELFNNFGGVQADITEVTFDDEAAAAISSVSPAYGPGSFQPEAGLLSAFDGEELEGTWRLIVVDSVSTIGGTLVSFGISGDANVVAAAVPEPSSFAMMFVGGLGFFARRRRQKKAVA